MSRAPDDETSKATKVLFGIKDSPKAPAEMYRQSVQLTPLGTSTRKELTHKGRSYLNSLATEKASIEYDKALLARVPRTLPKAPSQERIIKRDVEQVRGKLAKKDKDKDAELEP